MTPPPVTDPAADPSASRLGSANRALSVNSADPVVDRVAQSRVSILITGETGAGKEVLARRIHNASPRAAKPMISINCAAMCETLIDSQLFGHQRGAFTGAEHAQTGVIEAADGGTLFLDEVGELSLSAQAKLLRVLDDRVVVRVGGVATRPVDVRFIAATNRDMDRAIAEGKFREDLWYRLEGVRLNLLPLRARIDEIIPAAHQFLKEAVARDGLPATHFSDDAEATLMRHSWPGNFRELRNVVDRAALLCPDACIEVEHLLLSAERGHGGARGRKIANANPDGGVDDLVISRERIISALAACAGNQTRAAILLGMSRRTLITRLDELDIARPRARPLRSVPVERNRC